MLPVAKASRKGYISRMNARTKKILEEALELPSEEFDELTRELAQRVNDASAPDVRQAWAAIISRRAREVLDGTARTQDLDTVLDRIEANARAARR
jgi:hypothetical protein